MPLIVRYPTLRPVRVRRGLVGVGLSDTAAHQHGGRARRDHHQLLRHRANPFSPVRSYDFAGNVALARLLASKDRVFNRTFTVQTVKPSARSWSRPSSV